MFLRYQFAREDWFAIKKACDDEEIMGKARVTSARSWTGKDLVVLRAPRHPAGLNGTGIARRGIPAQSLPFSGMRAQCRRAAMDLRGKLSKDNAIDPR